MGKVIIRKRGDTWDVAYEYGKGKNRRVVYRETLDAKDVRAAADHIGKVTEDIRKQINPKRVSVGV